MIEISQLQVVRAGSTICAVEKLNVASGERLVVTGANGSGKTTLLRVLAGLENDYHGTCQVEVAPKARTYLHQHPFLFRGSVLANVRYGERGRVGESGATTWLERLVIAQLAHRTTQNLSGGEVRRVALARALACRPQLLLLDEPLAELDPTAAETVCQVLNDLSETTIVVASPTALPATLSVTTFNLD